MQPPNSHSDSVLPVAPTREAEPHTSTNSDYDRPYVPAQAEGSSARMTPYELQLERTIQDLNRRIDDQEDQIWGLEEELDSRRRNESLLQQKLNASDREAARARDQASHLRHNVEELQ